MTAGLIGCMTTPAQGNRIPPGAAWAADNGKFGKGWPGHTKWFRWLCRRVFRYGPERCRFAVAPDIPFDAAGTLAESRPWLPRIRSLGVPVAFAAQDGSEAPGLIPWGEFDVLFLAGTTEWKLSEAAADLAAEAHRRGLTVHMGRVNTIKRIRHAAAIRCDSADGTCFAHGVDENFPIVLTALDQLARRQPPHVQYPLPI